jgi:hypothetical protein
MPNKPFIETSIDVTGKHKLKFLEKVHRYKLDGEWVSGATTINKAYPMSRGLLRWYIKQGIEEFDSGKKLKAAADVGTLTHDYLFALRTGGKFDLSKIEGHKDEEKIRKRFLEADKWVKSRENEKLIMAEKICASPQYKFAGKFDVLVERDGKYVLQDYKASKDFFESQYIQGGGYAVMIEHWYGLHVSEIEIIRLNDNTEEPESLAFSGSDVEEFKQQFITCHNTSNFQKKWGKFFEQRYEEKNPWLKKWKENNGKNNG